MDRQSVTKFGVWAVHRVVRFWFSSGDREEFCASVEAWVQDVIFQFAMKQSQIELDSNP